MNEFEILYAPIIGAGEDYHGHQAVETPDSTMTRTIRLREEYEDLKRDLMEEVNMVDTRMIKPAQEAKDYLQPLKKTIKKREDRKVGQQTKMMFMSADHRHSSTSRGTRVVLTAIGRRPRRPIVMLRPLPKRKPTWPKQPKLTAPRMTTCAIHYLAFSL